MDTAGDPDRPAGRTTSRPRSPATPRRRAPITGTEAPGPRRGTRPRRRASADRHLGRPQTAVVVTGGASGIGRACALVLAEVGRAVAVWDRDLDGAVEVAARCREDFAVAAVAV